MKDKLNFAIIILLNAVTITIGAIGGGFTGGIAIGLASATVYFTIANRFLFKKLKKTVDEHFEKIERIVERFKP